MSVKKYSSKVHKHLTIPILNIMENSIFSDNILPWG